MVTTMQTKLDLKLCEGAYSNFHKELRGKYNGFTYSNVRNDVKRKGLSYLLPGADELIQVSVWVSEVGGRRGAVHCVLCGYQKSAGRAGGGWVAVALFLCLSIISGDRSRGMAWM